MPRSFLSFWTAVRNVSCILLILVHATHDSTGECVKPCLQLEPNFYNLATPEQAHYVTKAACIPPLDMLHNISQYPAEAFEITTGIKGSSRRDGFGNDDEFGGIRCDPAAQHTHTPHAHAHASDER